MTTLRVYHGTQNTFGRHDKRAEDATSAAATIHAEAHFFTTSPAAASGYAGADLGANVRWMDIAAEDAIVFDAAGAAWRDTHEVLIDGMIAGDRVDAFRRRVAAAYLARLRELRHDGAALTMIPNKIAHLRRERARKGKRRQRSWWRKRSDRLRSAQSELRAVLEAMIAAYQPGARVAIVRNSGDSPILSDYDGAPHDVVIVIGDPAEVAAR